MAKGESFPMGIDGSVLFEAMDLEGKLFMYSTRIYRPPPLPRAYTY